MIDSYSDTKKKKTNRTPGILGVTNNGSTEIDEQPSLESNWEKLCHFEWNCLLTYF